MQNKELIRYIKEYQNHQTGVFNLIYNEYKKLLYHYGKKIGERDAVYDMTSFLAELLFNINVLKFKEDSSEDLHKYIAVCLRNKYYLMLKTGQNMICCGSELTADITEPPRDFDNSIFIKECLSLVTKTERKILILRYFYDYSDYEISEKLHISRQAVNKARNKAIEKIRKNYKD